MILHLIILNHAVRFAHRTLSESMLGLLDWSASKCGDREVEHTFAGDDDDDSCHAD